jgi:uncharacterized protein (TIGR02996 family)
MPTAEEDDKLIGQVISGLARNVRGPAAQAVANLTASEKASLSPRTLTKSLPQIGTAFRQMSNPDLETARIGAAQAGRSRRDWYRKAGSFLTKLLPGQAERFIALLGATSPSNSPDKNYQAAQAWLYAWGQLPNRTKTKLTALLGTKGWTPEVRDEWERDFFAPTVKRVGPSISPIRFYQTLRPNIARSLAEPVDKLVAHNYLGFFDSAKIDNFRRNLLASAPSVKDSYAGVLLDAFVPDRWEGRILGSHTKDKGPGRVSDETIFDPTHALAAQAATRLAVDKLNRMKAPEEPAWTPADFQAAEWSTVRSLAKIIGRSSRSTPLAGSGVDPTNEHTGKDLDAKSALASIRHKDIAHTPDFQDAIARMHEYHDKLAKLFPEHRETVDRLHSIPPAQESGFDPDALAVDPKARKALIPLAEAAAKASGVFSNVMKYRRRNIPVRLARPSDKSSMPPTVQTPKPSATSLPTKPAPSKAGLMAGAPIFSNPPEPQGNAASLSGVQQRAKEGFGRGYSVSPHDYLPSSAKMPTGERVPIKSGSDLDRVRAANSQANSAADNLAAQRTKPADDIEATSELPRSGQPAPAAEATPTVGPASWWDQLRHHGTHAEEWLDNLLDKGRDPDWVNWLAKNKLIKGLGLPFKTAGDLADKYLLSRRQGYGDLIRYASVTFASPNTDQNLDFNASFKRMQSPHQAAYRSLAEHLYRQLGLNGKFRNAIGDWTDGAENSLVHTLEEGGDLEKMKYAAAWLGLLGNQKAVLHFQEKKDGPDSVYEIHLPGAKPEDVRKSLDQHQIAYRTLVPEDGGVRVLVYDQGRQLRPNVSLFAGTHNARVRESTGQGQFIGDSSDSPTRTAARSAYRKLIDAFESRGGSASGSTGGGADGGGGGSRGGPQVRGGDQGAASPDARPSGQDRARRPEPVRASRSPAGKVKYSLADREGFEKRLAEDPFNHSVHGVYADFLEEQGDPEAEFHRWLWRNQVKPARYGDYFRTGRGAAGKARGNRWWFAKGAASGSGKHFVESDLFDHIAKNNYENTQTTGYFKSPAEAFTALKTAWHDRESFKKDMESQKEADEQAALADPRDLEPSRPGRYARKKSPRRYSREHQTFLAAMKRDPWDRKAHAAYADHLDAQDDPDAAFHRWVSATGRRPWKAEDALDAKHNYRFLSSGHHTPEEMLDAEWLPGQDISSDPENIPAGIFEHLTSDHPHFKAYHTPYAALLALRGAWDKYHTEGSALDRGGEPEDPADWWKKNYARVQAPQGGVIARGTFYQGGKMLPEFALKGQASAAPDPSKAGMLASAPVKYEAGDSGYPGEPHFSAAFPGAKPVAERPGEYVAESGGRRVYMEHAPDKKSVRVDFTDARPDVAGVPSAVQPGSMDLARSLRTLAGGLKKANLGLSYAAINQGRGAHRRDRADVYGRILKSEGWQQTGGPGVNDDYDYSWSPVRMQRKGSRKYARELPCHECGGVGWKGSEKCGNCGGSGKMEWSSGDDREDDFRTQLDKDPFNHELHGVLSDHLQEQGKPGWEFHQWMWQHRRQPLALSPVRGKQRFVWTPAGHLTPRPQDPAEIVPNNVFVHMSQPPISEPGLLERSRSGKPSSRYFDSAADAYESLKQAWERSKQTPQQRGYYTRPGGK